MKTARFPAITSIFLTLLIPALLNGQRTDVESAAALPRATDSTGIADTGTCIKAPTGIEATDTPNDGGRSITVQWIFQDTTAVSVVGYEIYGSQDRESGYQMMGFVGREIFSYRVQTQDGLEYFFKVRAKTRDGAYSPFSKASAGATSKPEWFHTGRINALVAVVLFISLLVFFVMTARKGKSLFIRKIAGLDALEEAVGRATEMGKPILYVPGLSTMSDVATIAAINILGPVAKKVAEYESTIIVPNADPIVMSVTRQVVKESFLEAGRPDAYNDDMVFFLTDSQFGFAAAVDGIMMREKPATNLFIGMFWAESLILAETGNMTGAIQIAGTDAVAQLPFFVTACDYTIIGEELYAASAYLSRTPVLMGSLKAQDIGKAILLIVVTGVFLFAIVNTAFLLITKTANPTLTRLIQLVQSFFGV
jgi:hypothetical protein